MRSALSIIVVVGFVGCGFTNDTTYGKQKTGSEKLAITNAEGEAATLRTGTSINVTTSEDLALQPNHVYRVRVTNINTGTEVAQPTDPHLSIEGNARVAAAIAGRLAEEGTRFGACAPPAGPNKS